MRAKLTYANVMATIAVFVALGGTGYAATKLTGRDIQDATLTSKDVKDRSLLKRDFKRGQLPAGAKGDRGDQGAQGIQGLQGIQGEKGEQGETGAPGSAKGWMRVNPSDAAVGGVRTTPMTSPPPHSKGVISVVQPDRAPTSDPAGDSKFCFNLTFTPEVAATSPHYNNNASVGVTLPGDYSSGLSVNDPDCPADHRDAVAQTRGANTSAEVYDTIFSIIFE